MSKLRKRSGLKRITVITLLFIVGTYIRGFWSVAPCLTDVCVLVAIYLVVLRRNKKAPQPVQSPLKPQPQPIYFLTSNIAKSTPYSKRWGLITYVCTLTEVKLSAFKHWAIVIDGWCYEISNKEAKFSPRRVSLKHWEIEHRVKFTADNRPLGYTLKDCRTIEAEAEEIWKDKFNEDYNAIFRNCQSFVKALLERIECEEQPSQDKQQEQLPLAQLPETLSNMVEDTAKKVFLVATVFADMAFEFLDELLD